MIVEPCILLFIPVLTISMEACTDKQTKGKKNNKNKLERKEKCQSIP